MKENLGNFGNSPQQFALRSYRIGMPAHAKKNGFVHRYQTYSVRVAAGHLAPP
jgi:hypothetical protein